MPVPIWKLLKRFIATRTMMHGKTLKTSAKCKYKQTKQQVTQLPQQYCSDQIYIYVYIYIAFKFGLWRRLGKMIQLFPGDELLLFDRHIQHTSLE